MANKHQTYLENHCRLCAKSLGMVKYACINYSSFLSIWGVDPTSDSADSADNISRITGKINSLIYNPPTSVTVAMSLHLVLLHH